MRCTRIAVMDVCVPTGSRGDGGKVELLEWLGELPHQLIDFADCPHR